VRDGQGEGKGVCKVGEGKDAIKRGRRCRRREDECG